MRHNINDNEENEIISRQLESGDNSITQRISIHEIFESIELEKLLADAIEQGIDHTMFAGDFENSDFQLCVVNDENLPLKIGSINSFLENIRKLGKKRPSDSKI